MKRSGILIAGLLGVALVAVHAAYDDAGMPIEFTLIDGGKFSMGTDSGAKNATPINEVSIRAFDISDTLVTVEQYSE